MSQQAVRLNINVQQTSARDRSRNIISHPNDSNFLNMLVSKTETANAGDRPLPKSSDALQSSLKTQNAGIKYEPYCPITINIPASNSSPSLHQNDDDTETTQNSNNSTCAALQFAAYFFGYIFRLATTFSWYLPKKSDQLSETLKPTTITVDSKKVECLVESQEKIVGKYVPPQRRKGKYVPPHRRKEEAGRKDNLTNNEKIDLKPQSSLHHNDSDHIVGPSRRLGGCADPTLIEGSICDPMYIQKKSSVVGKVDSKPYGSFGGCQSSGKADQSNNIQWEVGAVSKCGIRSSNEDSYLVLNDLLAEATIKDDSTSFFKSFQSHGIFAIFDGHCGNHTARFAAEKFPSILLDESMKDEFMAGNGKHMSNEEKIHHLLKSVLIRLDCEFCDMCTANGRDWESGATALIAIVIGDTLAVAGLGDSNGVLSCTLSEGSNIKENGWSKLDNYRPKGCSINHGADVVWKKIVKTHSPSREDERKRIEEANGWITTETEISCSQIHRVNWDDYDVIDIVGRSIGNGKAEVGRILSISRVCGDLAVSRALGDKEFKAAYNILHTEGVLDEDNSAVEWESDSVFMKDRLFKGDLISSIPEINLYSLGEGKIDEFLLLACDGLWDVMDAIDAVRITRNLLFEKGFSAKESADRLAELAKGLGSSDNISVIVVHFHVEEKG